MRSPLIRLLLALFLLSGAANGAVQPLPAITHVATTNTLSAHLERTRLDAVLAELSRQSGIVVHIHPASAAAEITAEFDELPLQEGIKRLLSEHSYVLIYDQLHPQDNGIATIYVLKQDFVAPPQQHRTAAQHRSTPSEATALLQALWAMTDPEERAAALQSIAEHDLNGLLEAITAALHGSDLQREAVLNALQTLSQELPPSLLSEVATSDPDPAVRMNALALLDELGQEAFHNLIQTPPTAARETALALLSKVHSQALADTAVTALGDPDPNVRGMALETLYELTSYRQSSLQTVTALALNDPQPELRIRALEWLVSTAHSSARVPLNQALQDTDPRVTERALELLAELNTLN